MHVILYMMLMDDGILLHDHMLQMLLVWMQDQISLCLRSLDMYLTDGIRLQSDEIE